MPYSVGVLPSRLFCGESLWVVCLLVTSPGVPAGGLQVIAILLSVIEPVTESQRQKYGTSILGIPARVTKEAKRESVCGHLKLRSFLADLLSREN